MCAGSCEGRVRQVSFNILQSDTVLTGSGHSLIKGDKFHWQIDTDDFD